MMEARKSIVWCGTSYVTVYNDSLGTFPSQRMALLRPSAKHPIGIIYRHVLLLRSTVRRKRYRY